MKNNAESSIICEIKVNIKEYGEIRYSLIYHALGEDYGLAGMGYSIEIISIVEGKEEYAFLEDVSRQYEEAVDLIMNFAKNTVTAESSLYIMEDLMS